MREFFDPAVARFPGVKVGDLVLSRRVRKVLVAMRAGVVGLHAVCGASCGNFARHIEMLVERVDHERFGLDFIVFFAVLDEFLVANGAFEVRVIAVRGAGCRNCRDCLIVVSRLDDERRRICAFNPVICRIFDIIFVVIAAREALVRTHTVFGASCGLRDERKPIDFASSVNPNICAREILFADIALVGDHDINAVRLVVAEVIGCRHVFVLTRSDDCERKVMTFKSTALDDALIAYVLVYDGLIIHNDVCVIHAVERVDIERCKFCRTRIEDQVLSVVIRIGAVAVVVGLCKADIFHVAIFVRHADVETIARDEVIIT